MRVSARLLLVGGLALTLGLGLPAGTRPGRAAGDKGAVGQPLIPDDSAKDLIKYLGQVEQDSLKAGPGKVEKKDWQSKVKTVPLFIAVVTQCTKGGDAKQLAALRAAALQLSEAAEGGKTADAQSQAAALANLQPGAAGGGADLGSLEDKAELLDFMGLLRLRSKGGVGFGLKPPAAATTDGYEAKLLGLQKPLSAANMNKQSADLVRMGYFYAALSEVADVYTPKKKEGDKDPKKWAEWNQDMRDASLQFAAAAQARDSKALKAAAVKLNASCNDCHGTFRD